jgi:hypothetical protein
MIRSREYNCETLYSFNDHCYFLRTLALLSLVLFYLLFVIAAS